MQIYCTGRYTIENIYNSAIVRSIRESRGTFSQLLYFLCLKVYAVMIIEAIKIYIFFKCNSTCFFSWKTKFWVMQSAFNTKACALKKKGLGRKRPISGTFPIKTRKKKVHVFAFFGRVFFFHGVCCGVKKSTSWLNILGVQLQNHEGFYVFKKKKSEIAQVRILITTCCTCAKIPKVPKKGLFPGRILFFTARVLVLTVNCLTQKNCVSTPKTRRIPSSKKKK